MLNTHNTFKQIPSFPSNKQAVTELSSFLLGKQKIRQLQTRYNLCTDNQIYLIVAQKIQKKNFTIRNDQNLNFTKKWSRLVIVWESFN